MRVAFSGSHRVGKTTLLEAVAAELPRYASVDEPYCELEEQGYEHFDPPALEDFEAQLEQSIASLEGSGRDVLFDRCAADVLAYLLTHEDADEFDLDEHIERVREAMATLDLIVFVPIESPDRIPLPSHEERRFRQRVHKMLEYLLLEDPHDFGVEVLVVEGELRQRLASVMPRVR